MMPFDAKSGQRLSTLFREQPCWMIEPLGAELRYSIPSDRRFLTEVGCYGSLTHSGGGCTLRPIPRFGRDGLWDYADIGFSRAGELIRNRFLMFFR
jgi:hypothetical protein